MVISTLFKDAQQTSPARIYNFKRENLLKLFAKLEYTNGVEVGVAEGRFSERMCQLVPNLTLHAVDTWAVGGDLRSREVGQRRADDRYAEAVARLSPFNATCIKDTSVHASFSFEDNSLDFVYIDGCHEFDYVMEDLIVWGRKVRKGGIIAGHDYYRFKRAGVIPAVDTYTHQHGVAELMLTDERTPSFFFEKTWN